MTIYVFQGDNSSLLYFSVNSLQFYSYYIISCYLFYFEISSFSPSFYSFLQSMICYSFLHFNMRVLLVFITVNLPFPRAHNHMCIFYYFLKTWYQFLTISKCFIPPYLPITWWWDLQKTDFPKPIFWSYLLTIKMQTVLYLVTSQEFIKREIHQVSLLC